MSVVKDIDKSLFEGYAKPKSNAVTTILRGGILDPEMDWYETTQPTGQAPLFAFKRVVLITTMDRDTTIHV